jgi:hypothetical protein
MMNTDYVNFTTLDAVYNPIPFKKNFPITIMEFRDYFSDLRELL